MDAKHLVLAIESSCDDTAVAVVRAKDTGQGEILAHCLHTQLEEHTPFGGVVPELAARAHVVKLAPLVEKTLAAAKIAPSDLTAIAATAGPGLIGGVLVGVGVAKGFATALQKPFIPVNHLEGHALTVRLIEDVSFPYLLLLVSGGHCQLLLVKGVGQYELLGETLDDAPGEAFDKLAKMLNLGFPGGPYVEKIAATGITGQYALPRPLLGRKDYQFSFSGMKAAARRLVEGEGDALNVANLCADYQAMIGWHLKTVCNRAMAGLDGQCQHLVVAGGVAANQHIREGLQGIADAHSWQFTAPPQRWCTDNAAMIAWAAIERLRAGLVEQDTLAFKPRPRWPLIDMNVVEMNS